MPSLVDVFLLFLLLAAFARPLAWQSLLSDGDTGWHIRTGELILRTGAVPARDPFSFSRAGEPWFAWEWLSDVSFALLHRWHGLEAVAAFSGAILTLSAGLLLCWLLRRGAGFGIGLPVTLATVSASTVHYLARPHIFTLLFLTLALWVLDEDRRRPTRMVWGLIPLSALWANLHGGFVAWIAILGLLAAVNAAARDWRGLRRYATLCGLCFGATFLNPYGWHLHQHISSYLSSSWILDNVQEFQSPSIRSENMVVFAVLLLVGVALALRSLVRRQWFEASMVLVWAFAAMRSARHVPLFVVIAAPVIASECAFWWAAKSRAARPRAAARVLWELSQDFGRSRRITLWAPMFCGLAIWMTLAPARLPDFPAERFPVAAVTRNLDRLLGDGAMPGGIPRILTSDQWGDYLIFHLYPRQRVFFDGRSDFYGPTIGRDYAVLLSAGRDWRRVLDQYGFQLALLPLDWPLGAVLEGDPDWRLVYRDAVSVLLVRKGTGLKEMAKTAELCPVGESGRLVKAASR
ncbi:MAG TPA: hypothetical protein VKJ01_26335 [Candidatus Solibacter sp.]|nr:hypothetical protein [Candidatus Solibacter sp.]